MRSRIAPAAGVASVLLLAAAWAETTHVWRESDYSEFRRGHAENIALSSDGSLSLAPALAVSLALGAILVTTIEEDLESENRALADGVVAEAEQLLVDPMDELIELARHIESIQAASDV